MDQDTPYDAGPCLTLRQRSTLPAIVASTSLADAARRSRVSLSTLKRWMKDPAFVYELGRLNDAALGLAHSQFQGLMLRAVANLDHDIDNPNAHIRLSAILLPFTTAASCPTSTCPDTGAGQVPPILMLPMPMRPMPMIEDQTSPRKLPCPAHSSTSSNLPAPSSLYSALFARPRAGRLAPGPSLSAVKAK